MYIVGIDIAKRKHEAAVIDGEGTVIIKPFSFTNNCSGYPLCGASSWVRSYRRRSRTKRAAY